MNISDSFDHENRKLSECEFGELLMQEKEKLESFASGFSLLKRSISSVMVGQERVIESVLISLLAGGHVLLEGVPGLGKTTLIRTLAQSLELPLARIQFTPDLMPADILGTTIFEQTMLLTKMCQT